MRSVILEIKERFYKDGSCLMHLYRGMVSLRCGVTRDCLKCMGKLLVDRERLTMAVIIGRIVEETCFRRKGRGRIAYLERHARV